MSDSPTGSSSHTAFECTECEHDIRPGDTRVPTENGGVHISCAAIRNTRKVYSFTITNPPKQDVAGFSLWFDAGDREYPILYNTGGLDAFASASKAFGGDDHIQPTTSFFQAIAYTYHWLQSYRPLPNNTERIKKEIGSEIQNHYPNGKIPTHEEWALHRIITQLYRAPVVQPEWVPIVDHCETITGFSVPDTLPYTEK